MLRRVEERKKKLVVEWRLYGRRQREEMNRMRDDGQEKKKIFRPYTRVGWVSSCVACVCVAYRASIWPPGPLTRRVLISKKK